MRVIKIQAVIGQGLPGVDAGTVSAVKVGLQAFPALQFDVRDDKIQLKPVPCRGAPPTGRRTGRGRVRSAACAPIRPSGAISRRLQCQVPGMKARRKCRRGQSCSRRSAHAHVQDCRAVRWPVRAVSVFPQQVIHRATACTRTPAMNFDDHAVSPEAQISWRSRLVSTDEQRGTFRRRQVISLVQTAGNLVQVVANPADLSKQFGCHVRHTPTT